MNHDAFAKILSSQCIFTIMFTIYYYTFKLMAPTGLACLYDHFQFFLTIVSTDIFSEMLFTWMHFFTCTKYPCICGQGLNHFIDIVFDH